MTEKQARAFQIMEEAQRKAQKRKKAAKAVEYLTLFTPPEERISRLNGLWR